MILIKGGIISTYSKRELWRKRVTKIIAITGSIILLVAALSYYGQHVGSFVITMKDAGHVRGLQLSCQEDYSDVTSRLTATPLSKATDTEYEQLPKNIDDGIGTKNHYDKRREAETYFCYSFYLINGGQEAVDYEMTLSLITATRNLDSILRFMLVEGDVEAYAETRTETVYAKAREDEGHEGEAEPLIGHYGSTPLRNYDYPVGYEYDIDSLTSLGDTTPFIDDKTVFRKTIEDFQRGQIKKYTLVMWLDGWDAQSDNSMLGGALKLSLLFSIPEENIEEE